MNVTKIRLKNLRFYAYHGALEEEQKLGQRFEVDVVVTLENGLDLKADRPEATVNYVALYECVQAIAVGRRFQLLEALGEAVADSILKNFTRVTEVEIAIRKPSVPVDCICDYFEVELTRTRAEDGDA